MDKVINVLKDLQKVIQRGHTNFKKSPRDRVTVEYIETRQDILESDWTKFRDTNTKLYENFDVEELKKNDIEAIYDTTEEEYITYKCLLKTALNKLRVRSGPEKPSQTSTVTGLATPLNNPLVKLPKISIPMYSGKYGEWTTFYNLFTSLVHKNPSLDNVQKLHYLKTHLTGEAEQLIRHTPITDANYVVCWSKLEKRYSNKKYLANCILKRLFGQKRMHTESATSLKELLDTTSDCLSALKNLSIDVSTWDVIIIHIVTFKLDPETRKQWELSTSTSDSNDLPTFEQFKNFIENRFRALECIEPKRSAVHQGTHNSHGYNPKVMLATKTSSMRCEFCTEPHKLCFCKKFAKQSIESRRDFVAKKHICFNCLGSNHNVYECKKPTKCRVCNKRHHSLLHPSEVFDNKEQNNTDGSSRSSTSANQIISCLSTNQINSRLVLLATALIKAESGSGELQTVRALVDQGSQACFITEATVQLLRLKKIPVKGIVSGLGTNRSMVARHMVNITIQSRVDREFKHHINAYVLNKITSYLPERSINTAAADWVDLHSLCLADPEFNKPNRIDILLGADTYSCIIKEGLLKNPNGTLIAQNTAFGWILSGTINIVNNARSSEGTENISVMHVQINEDDMLRRFWEIEEHISPNKILTLEEQRCQEFYSATTRRNNEGRYVVKLPFRDEIPLCKGGNSRNIAENRFRALEKRLAKDNQLKKSYTEVIEEYIQLGHMRAVKENDNRKEESVYLPHHAVIRHDKATTKVRIVFNASEKNNKGISLNDSLMIGPTLQPDLRHTVLRWRVHEIGLVADIVKMYRQINVADEDVAFQRILWRDSSTKEIKDYELMTVTFGTASAPYQAVRTLHQIAYDEGDGNDIAKDKVLNSFYMDDLMTGCSSIEEGVKIYKQITELLQKGGFKLQKWNSNNQSLLSIINRMESDTIKGKIKAEGGVDEDSKGQSEYVGDKINQRTTKRRGDSTIHTEDKINKEVDIKLDSTIKILGLTWIRNEDLFQYSVTLPPPTTAPVTKRSIISDIARLFDPLGWLAPSVVLAKIFIQKLWIAGVAWDENLTNELVKEWYTYRDELSLLATVKIPRWLGTNPDDVLELHGFCDASKSAYSAVVYLRITDISGKVKVALLVARTRVAPIKQISIPRLELCGAVLLAQLLVETAEVLNIAKNNIRAWTDSTVVLAWLNSHPSRWKTFVANRTSNILTTIGSPQWFHVSTKENPADCASRGLLPSSFIRNGLWFHGPSFLKDKQIAYKRPQDLNVDLETSIKAHMSIVPDEGEESIFKKFSSLAKLLRVGQNCYC